MAKFRRDGIGRVIGQGSRPSQGRTAMLVVWLARLRQMMQREHTTGLWMMSRDGRVVRQPWEIESETADMNCAMQCCM